MTELPTPIASWESFYVIAGSSAAALTGLQFVTMALFAEVRHQTTSGDGVSAFGTPNVVHFSIALLVSCTLSAPWRSMHSAAMALIVIGLSGLAYAAIVIRRARNQSAYEPVFEDWLWHAALPVVAYGTLAIAPFLMPSRDEGALFFVAAATLLLVFIGIHNAWDTVTYMVLQKFEQAPKASGQASVEAGDPTARTNQEPASSEQRARGA